MENGVSFTDRASKILKRASTIAAESGCRHVGPEHMMQAILAEPGTVPVCAVDSFGVSPADLSRRVACIAKGAIPEFETTEGGDSFPAIIERSRKLRRLSVMQKTAVEVRSQDGDTRIARFILLSETVLPTDHPQFQTVAGKVSSISTELLTSESFAAQGFELQKISLDV